MADFGTEIEALDDQVSGLEDTLGSAQEMTAAFQSELLSMQDVMVATTRQTASLSRSVGWGLRRAFDGLVFDGMKLSDAFRQLSKTMIDSVLTQALKPVQNALGGALIAGLDNLVGGVLPFQNGASFSGGKVTPFARGGVVSAATSFPMRGGVGLMGEAGPEAIMPLARGQDGTLGVRTQAGGRDVRVTMNISTPDVESFKRSRTQVAAMVSRAIGRGARNN